MGRKAICRSGAEYARRNLCTFVRAALLSSCEDNVAKLHIAAFSPPAGSHIQVDGSEITALANSLSGKGNVLMCVFGSAICCVHCASDRSLHQARNSRPHTCVRRQTEQQSLHNSFSCYEMFRLIGFESPVRLRAESKTACVTRPVLYQVLRN